MSDESEIIQGGHYYTAPGDLAWTNVTDGLYQIDFYNALLNIMWEADKEPEIDYFAITRAVSA